MRNSLFLAFGSATIVTLFTSIISYLIVRGKGVGRRILDFISMIPVAIPATAFAIALLWAWLRAPIPIYGTLWILLFAYMTLFSAYGVKSISAGLRQIDPELEECSQLCGVSRLGTLRKIIMPLLKPAMLSTWIIVFIYSLRELSASILLYSYGTETISVVLVEMYEMGTFCLAAALGLIQILITVAAIFAFQKILGVHISDMLGAG